MREINLNGYIDEEIWFGDEITPEALHEVIYGPDNNATDDVHIILNSYGGSCNAATRMFDDLRAYPGNVFITISGTAASAATVLAMAADRLEMTPGSLFMIHDPIVGAVGNETELMESVRLLQVCKQSILNVYAIRCRVNKMDVADRMKATCWMDANTALSDGFVDGITEGVRVGAALNMAEPHLVNQAEAEKRVQAWIDRKALRLSHEAKVEDTTTKGNTMGINDMPVETCTLEAFELDASNNSNEPNKLNTPNKAQTSNEPDVPAVQEDKPNMEQPEQMEQTGTPVAQLQKRLGLIMPTRR